jgi:hypothetical protein
MNNNPVVYADPSGHDPITFLLINAAAVLLTTSCTPTPPPSPAMDSAVGMAIQGSDGKWYPSIGTYIGNGQVITHDHFDKLPGSLNPEDSLVALYDSEGNQLPTVYNGSDLSRTTSGDRGSSIITFPDDLPFSSATLTTDFPLSNGLKVTSTAWKNILNPREGMYLEYGSITDLVGNSFYTNQDLPGNNSGTGGWVYDNGQWYLIGNLTGGPGEAGKSPRFYHEREKAEQDR